MSFKKDLNNIHDKSYKDLFSTNDAFLSFVNTFIQGEWVDKLEKDKLILVDKSYILSDYEELESDIVYNATIGEDNIIFLEFLERLKNIVINFSNLTSEEKLLLKGWIKNTTNSDEIYDMDELVENIFNENKK